MPTPLPRFALVLTCPERPGIVAAVSGFLAARQLTISESNQYSDPDSGSFFMRVEFAPVTSGPVPTLAELREGLAPVVGALDGTWQAHDLARRPRVVIAVSRAGHCLHDLLHRVRGGLLPIDVAAVFSNHDTLRSFTEWSGVPFHHHPVDDANRQAQEAALLDLVTREGADFVVLARYMQILSPTLVAQLAWRCINIHHSFLPSFKGARPYHQAYARGVKMIGATAHYVTGDLDEGPIIAQDARHVSHVFSPQELVALGQEVECAVLARAVGWHAQHRVFANGLRTIVFAHG